MPNDKRTTAESFAEIERLLTVDIAPHCLTQFTERLLDDIMGIALPELKKRLEEEKKEYCG